MVDFVRAIKRPFRDFKKLIIGILLNLPIPLVRIITNTMALGYAYNCGKTSSEGDYELPEWRNYWQLWINAFVAGIISLIYIIPVAILIFVFAKDLIMDYVTNETVFLVNLIQNPAGLVDIYGRSIIFIWLFSIMISYLLPIAILNWIKEGRFGSAFNFKDIFKKISTGKYFTAWLVVTVVGMGIGFITLKYIPFELLKDPKSIISETNILKLLILVIITSTIGFIKNIFDYTVYGNVLEELKK